MGRTRTPETVPLWGEALCLDYANSVDWSSEEEHFDPDGTDMLRTEDLLVRWGRRLALTSEKAGPVSPAELRQARALRDAVHRLFTAVDRGREPATADLDTLASTYAEAVRRGSLVAGDGIYQLGWPADDPRKIRFAVAADAIALLQDPGRLERVTRCPGRDCGWLFLNTSGRRRWCSMSTCGSRDKMRRLHQRRAKPAE